MVPTTPSEKPFDPRFVYKRTARISNVASSSSSPVESDQPHYVNLAPLTITGGRLTAMRNRRRIHLRLQRHHLLRKSRDWTRFLGSIVFLLRCYVLLSCICFHDIRPCIQLLFSTHPRLALSHMDACILTLVLVSFHVQPPPDQKAGEPPSQQDRTHPAILFSPFFSSYDHLTIDAASFSLTGKRVPPCAILH